MSADNNLVRRNFRVNRVGQYEVDYDPGYLSIEVEREFGNGYRERMKASGPAGDVLEAIHALEPRSANVTAHAALGGIPRPSEPLALESRRYNDDPPEVPVSVARLPHRGRVKWFNSEKGFGFLTPDDRTADVFVHYSAIDAAGFRTLNEQQVVEYSIEVGRRGPMASVVRVI